MWLKLVSAMWLSILVLLIHETGSISTVGSPSLQINNLASSKGVQKILTENPTPIVKALKTRASSANTSYISPQCLLDLNLYWKGLNNSELWALYMYDSDGRYSSGLLQGNVVWLGSYKGCYKAKPDTWYNVTLNGTVTTHRRTFKPKYCKSEWWYEYLPGIPMQLGTCVPESCSEDDVSTLLFDGLPGEPGFLVTDTYCPKKPDFSKDGSAIAACCILGVLAFVIAVATTYDAFILPRRRTKVVTKKEMVLDSNTNGVDNGGYINMAASRENVQTASDVSASVQEIKLTDITTTHTNGITNNVTNVEIKHEFKPHVPSKPEKLLLAFSIYSNLPKVLSAKQPKGSMPCINGIRFMSMVWIVLGHTWTIGIIGNNPVHAIQNAFDYNEVYNRFSHQAINQMNIAVDTFFILSAFLTTISFMKTTERQDGKIKVRQMIVYYVHRYFRLTPVMMIFIMICACFGRHIGSGPLWPKYIPATEDCRQSWWTHLIYLNNFIMTDKQCQPHTWYLANDFQFYVIAPLFMIPLALVPVSGIVIMVGLFIGHTISFTYLNYKSIYEPGSVDGWADLYIKPWCRIGPYLIGSALGYIIYRTKCKVRMPIVAIIAGWIIAFSLCMICVYLPYTNGVCPGCKEWAPAGRVVFDSIWRNLWALGVSWIIFACLSGYGGFVNIFLSWSGFGPLSRLSYISYLIHPVFIYYAYYTRYSLIYIQDINMIYFFLGHLSLALGASVVSTLAVEIPSLELDKLLIPRKKDK